MSGDEKGEGEGERKKVILYYTVHIWVHVYRVIPVYRPDDIPPTHHGRVTGKGGIAEFAVSKGVGFQTERGFS